MSLARSFTVGRLRCHLLEGGRMRLDGGAMFGVVPWTLWHKRIPPDERLRIPLAMRCMLIEHPDGLVLVDTALGDKEDAKFHDIYGIENAGTHGPTQLDDALHEVGYKADDVQWVVNTHLHFDHAGGNTARDGAPDQLKPTFPNATYVVQRRELEFARAANERTRGSYLPGNFDPIDAAGKWKLLEGPGEVLPGISVRVTPGHVPWHQAVMVQDGGETTAFVADLIPTSVHLPLPWIMGFDVEPLRTLETKRAFLREAVAEGWRLVFEHDPVVASGVPVAEGKGIVLRDVIEVASRNS